MIVKCKKVQEKSLFKIKITFTWLFFFLLSTSFFTTKYDFKDGTWNIIKFLYPKIFFNVNTKNYCNHRHEILYLWNMLIPFFENYTSFLNDTEQKVVPQNCSKQENANMKRINDRLVKVEMMWQFWWVWNAFCFELAVSCKEASRCY